MSSCYEIERKFLVEFPDLSELNTVKRIGICQTYLADGENGSQRRVRRLEENGTEAFTYTEKVFLTPVTREETEYQIDSVEYEKLLKQVKHGCVPINKVRYCFEYKQQLFELDIYPFSETHAIMEIELDSAEQEINFPDNVNVIKEVSGDARYSNAALAAAGAFPVE